MSRIIRRHCPHLLFALVLLAAGLVFISGAIAAAPNQDELIAIGRDVYQKGVLADGSPVKALAMGDVEVSGDQFTCMNCHRRSGLGGGEGPKLVLPVNGASLLTPRVDLNLARPAYTLDTFTRAMLLGVNPQGQAFDPIMPKYDLPEMEAKALFAYLLSLSSTFSPGVDNDDLHFATVVSADADPQQRQAMLAVITTYFNNRNLLLRNELKRRQAAVFFRDYRTKAYRHWVHHVWEVSGPPATWPAQLEAYYRKQPVFALVSGLVGGSWVPVHDFCRVQKIPCILPNTDLPEIDSPPDFYTLYYSRGVTLEAQVLAEELKGAADGGTIIQVARPGSAGADGRAALQTLLPPGQEVVSFDLPDAAADGNRLRQQLVAARGAALVLWLDKADLQRFASMVGAEGLGTPAVYVSSSLLNADLDAVPVALRKTTHAVHPFVLPQDRPKRFLQVSAWLKANQLELTNPRLQGQTFFACLLLNSGIEHMLSYFYREYLLDILDHRDNMAIYSGNYPHLSFGPEQRFLAKGAYVIDLADGNSRWVVPGI